MTEEDGSGRNGLPRKSQSSERQRLRVVDHPRRTDSDHRDPEALDYQLIFEQYAQADHRGLLLIGPGRRVLAINAAACEMVGYTGSVPCPVSDVVRDVNAGFAVGEAFHDRHDLWHESYAPNPDRLLLYHFVPILAPSGDKQSQDHSLRFASARCEGRVVTPGPFPK